MTYDPALGDPVSQIRHIVGDRTEPEIFPDVTYSATLGMYTNWKRAAADMAEAMAVYLDAQITSFNAPGALGVGWSDRAKTLRDAAKRLRAEADAEDAGSEDLSYVGRVVTWSSDFLAGPNGGDEWG